MTRPNNIKILPGLLSVAVFLILILANPGHASAAIPGDFDHDNDVDGLDLAAYGQALSDGAPPLPIVEFVGQYCAVISHTDEMTFTSGWTPPAKSTITPPTLHLSWTTGPRKPQVMIST
ncbi:MAG: hypothetical protein JRI36_04580 [Deltaproteobacteria bacterium]|nr:hypothetical protein [Deltaproteobacteria bacterium]